MRDLYCKKCKTQQPHVIGNRKECAVCGCAKGVPLAKAVQPLTEKERKLVQKKIQTRLEESQNA
jgi:hypothetical protein